MSKPGESPPVQSEEASPAGKKPYEAPQVRDYGPLAALTAGGSGFEPEGGSGMIGMM